MARSQRLRVFIRPRLERVVYVVTRLARTCLLKVFDHSLHDHRLEAQLKATSLTVSIIIPVKDSLSRGLPELVASLKSQTHSNIEIIAVDSGSTDLNSIENFFAKLKALLRKAAERHFDALVDRIKIILQSVTAEECANYFIAAGYVKA